MIPAKSPKRGKTTVKQTKLTTADPLVVKPVAASRPRKSLAKQAKPEPPTTSTSVVVRPSKPMQPVPSTSVSFFDAIERDKIKNLCIAPDLHFWAQELKNERLQTLIMKQKPKLPPPNLPSMANSLSWRNILPIQLCDHSDEEDEGFEEPPLVLFRKAIRRQGCASVLDLWSHILWT